MLIRIIHDILRISIWLYVLLMDIDYPIKGYTIGQIHQINNLNIINMLGEKQLKLILEQFRYLDNAGNAVLFIK